MNNRRLAVEAKRHENFVRARGDPVVRSPRNSRPMYGK